MTYNSCYEKPSHILSKKEFNQLLTQYRNGDKYALEKLIIHNQKLVLSRVERLNYYRCDFDDLFQLGMIGLVKAIDNFDMSKEYEFSTFASKCIDNEMLMYLRKNSKNRDMLSIDDTPEDGYSLKETLSDEYDLEEDCIDREMVLVIRNKISELSDRERVIVSLYYGINSSRRYSQTEIAEILGGDQAAISRNLGKILNKLKKELSDEIPGKRKMKKYIREKNV
ncbi:MAG: sigma-70 family RNA polymerase sigma factor [Bacilli bacterium]